MARHHIGCLITQHRTCKTQRPSIAGRSERRSPFAALLLLAVFAGCAHQHAASKKVVPSVSVQKLSPESVHVYREYVGRTAAFLSVDLRSQINAPVTGFYFRDGQSVHKGQLLYQLDARPYQVMLDAARARSLRADANLARAAAELRKAQDYVRRYAPLAGINAVPRQEYTDAMADSEVRSAELQQAQADQRVAQAELEQAQVNLSYTQIHAPISGIIGMRRLAPGAMTGGSDPMPLATISMSDPLRVDFSVSDADYLRYLAPPEPNNHPVHPASTETVSPHLIHWNLLLADGSTYPLPGKFYALARSADPRTDTVQVELLYPNPQGRLRPGQYANIRADMESRQNVLLVPVSAIRVSQGTKIVSVVGSDHVVAERSIETEERSGSSYIVKKGLQAGDFVIIGGEQKVKPGERVNPQIVAPSIEGPSS